MGLSIISLSGLRELSNELLFTGIQKPEGLEECPPLRDKRARPVWWPHCEAAAWKNVQSRLLIYIC